MSRIPVLLALFLLAIGGGAAPAEARQPLPDGNASELRTLVEHFSADRAGLLRRHDLASPRQRARLATFYAEQLSELEAMETDRLSVEGMIDWVLLRNRIRYEIDRLDADAEQEAEVGHLLPFQETLVRFHEDRRDLLPIDPRDAAARLSAITSEIAGAERVLREALRGDRQVRGLDVTPVVALRAASRLQALEASTANWFRFYDGYDPLFSWWVRTPYAAFQEQARALGQLLRQDGAGFRPGTPEPTIGDPLGREALLLDLEREMIAYTPEELLAAAEAALAWGEGQLREASRALGFGDDWLAALEYVKGRAPEPGQQIHLVTEMARGAEAFLDERDLVTIPPLAREIWRMEMLSPARQRIAPFFLGGEVVQVAFPTDDMSHEEKVMSLRSNNEHFSRAVVHHELIPGHHLQGYMTARYATHRSLFSTPFWGEGWALYWELLLWDLDFPRSPEDQIGMLVWRNHRAARILFSIAFHLGQMTPEEAVELLVTRVGFERSASEAEVRRSFTGQYPPLYQAGYLLGGMQLRALHREVVESGRMTNRAFHDHILKHGRMPIEMVRHSVLGEAPPRDGVARWRFLDTP
jgi:hypothetical protein